jgi:thiamine pyrophosphate-dependent acetolactate synthase large subunit-like protein
MNGVGHPKQRMPVQPTLEHLAQLRTETDIVVTNQSSARLWPRISQHPLDFNYNPSNMGGAIPLGLGLALSQPRRGVIVLSGDGSLLMSLGCLVTVIASGATNLSILLLDNGMYEVTGGQKTPASDPPTDFAGIARAAGFGNVQGFTELEDWRQRSAGFFAAPGPRFGWLSVGPTPPEVFGDSLSPIAERTEQFNAALQR